MNYYEFILPYNNPRAGESYHPKHTALQGALVTNAGGFIKLPDAACQRLKEDGNLERYLVATYHVACDEFSWELILEEIQKLFPKEPLLVALIGTATRYVARAD